MCPSTGETAASCSHRALPAVLRELGAAGDCSLRDAYPQRSARLLSVVSALRGDRSLRDAPRGGGGNISQPLFCTGRARVSKTTLEHGRVKPTGSSCLRGTIFYVLKGEVDFSAQQPRGPNQNVCLGDRTWQVKSLNRVSWGFRFTKWSHFSILISFFSTTLTDEGRQYRNKIYLVGALSLPFTH